MNKEEYLNIKQAGEISGLSHTTIRKAIKAGRLRASRPTWKVVIMRSDLDAFIQCRAVEPKAG